MIAVKMDNQRATAAYTEAFRRLARMSGFDHKAILRAEAGSILKQWAGRTKVATVEKADRRTRLHVVRSLGYTKAADRGDVTVNAGFRPAPFGRVWIKVRNGGGRNRFVLGRGNDFSAPSGKSTFTAFGRRMGSTGLKWLQNINEAEGDVTGKMARSIAKGRAAINLSRQSVVQIADSLGIDLLKVPGQGISGAGLAKARAAMATNGVFYRNGTSGQGGNEVKAYVDLINRLPYAQKIGMDRILAGVVAGRAKYIEQSYAKGAFDTQKNIMKAFPGLFTYTFPI